MAKNLVPARRKIQASNEEYAKALKRMLDRGVTKQEIAVKLNRTVSWVNKCLQYLPASD